MSEDKDPEKDKNVAACSCCEVTEEKMQAVRREAITQCKIYDALEVSSHAMSGHEGARLLLKSASITEQEIIEFVDDDNQRDRLLRLLRAP